MLLTAAARELLCCLIFWEVYAGPTIRDPDVIQTADHEFVGLNVLLS